jgi:cytochrome c
MIVLSTIALAGLALAHPFGIAKILQDPKGGDRPPVQSRTLHRDSKLSQDDGARLSSLSHSSEVEAGPAGSGDAMRGKILFEKRCTGCHALEADREGPRLAGVFGRKAGSVPGFDYSTGLKNSGLIWTDVTLEKWLTDPEMMVPDANMDFRVPKAQERLDVIAYLKATSQALKGA